MKCKVALGLLQQVENSIKDIRGFASATLLEKSYLAKFLVVYVCGIYEESIECIMNERISKLKSKRVSNFVDGNIQRSFRNPNLSNVLGLLGKFDKDWKKEIHKLPNKATAALNSICGNKNSIAHGTVCVITLTEAIQYYNDSKQVIEKIDEIVNF